MGCGSSTEVRAMTPASTHHYNNNYNTNKQRQQQRRPLEQHPNSVDNDHELEKQQAHQEMLRRQQEEQEKQEAMRKQQEEQEKQEAMRKQQEELKAEQEKQEAIRKQQEEQLALLRQQEEEMATLQQEEEEQSMLNRHEEQQAMLLGQKLQEEQQEESIQQQNQQFDDQSQEQKQEQNHDQQQEGQNEEQAPEDSTPEETLEQSRERLAVYGHYQENYTVKQLSDINLEHGHNVLFIWGKFVHLTAAFKDLMEPEVSARQAEMGEDLEGLFEKDMTHPVGIAYRIGIRMSKILKYVPKCKIARLVVLDNTEFWSDVQTDATKMATDLRCDNNITPYVSEYLEVLERFFELYAEFGGNIPPSPPTPDGDPNLSLYPLPKSVAADPESLRRWAETWEVFDFVVPEDGAWSWHGYKNLVFEDIKECVEYPPSRADLEEFDTEIEGEAGWDVIELDLLKNDITTDEQNKIWEERENRSDFDDPERMKKRRERLEKYFIVKYEWDSSVLDAYRGWADTIQDGWQKFQKLCDS